MEVADITKSGFQTGPLKLQKIQGKLKLYFMYTYNITIYVCLKHIRNIKNVRNAKIRDLKLRRVVLTER